MRLFPPVQICQTGPIDGATWGAGETIIFGVHGFGLKRVTAAGGAAADLTELNRSAGEVSHRLPQLLPGGGSVLFTIVRNAFDPRMDQAAVYTIATRARKILVDDAADARYALSGHLLFARMGKLLAVPFDVERLALRGAPVGILDDIMQSAAGQSANETGAMQLAVSATGAVAPSTSCALERRRSERLRTSYFRLRTSDFQSPPGFLMTG